mgnify:CR=1 FL=1
MPNSMLSDRRAPYGVGSNFKSEVSRVEFDVVVRCRWAARRIKEGRGNGNAIFRASDTGQLILCELALSKRSLRMNAQLYKVKGIYT